jgi:hypothetical protein
MCITPPPPPCTALATGVRWVYGVERNFAKIVDGEESFCEDINILLRCWGTENTNSSNQNKLTNKMKINLHMLDTLMLNCLC